jgi:hypothetical protein
MRRGLMIGLMALAVASVAQAQPRGPRPDGPPPGDRPGRGLGGPGAPSFHLFISPSGEPFRDPDGIAVWFARADTDKDAALSRAEFRADALGFFKVLDVDKDEVLSAFELQDYERRRVPEIAAVSFDRPRQPPGGKLVIGREGAAQFALLNEPQPVAGADLDLNGRVTIAEWIRTADRRFATLDKLKVEKLTRESLPPLPGEPGRKKR